jgi:hypothetical protein
LKIPAGLRIFIESTKKPKMAEIQWCPKGLFLGAYRPLDLAVENRFFEYVFDHQ